MKEQTPTPSSAHAPLRRLVLLGLAFVGASLSCGRDVTGPGAALRIARGISWNAQFPPAYQAAGAGASGVVAFDRVHVVLRHADGTVALDTVIDFPAGADSVEVALDVKLLPSAPASGEPLSLNLGYINAAGDTVFKGGPVNVTATPTSPGQAPAAPVTIPISYVGPGANAVGVQISPRSGAASSGQSFTFTAVAVDGNGVAIPNTPIVWNTLDPSLASIPSAAAGVVFAQNQRGSARIVAQLLTGPTDQVTLAVQPAATTIAAQSGSAQAALTGTTLPLPLVAVVTAADGLGVSGVTVNFAVASGGGSVGSASAVTNSAGLAQTSWKLGSAIGAQSVTASSGTLTGSPVTFIANAKSAAATKLFVGAQPGNTTAGIAISPIVIVAQTANGDTASGFTGAVTVSFGANPGNGTLGGTLTANAVAGLATFANLTVNRTGTGYTLAAASPVSTGITGVTTNAFNITAGPAIKLAFTAQPVSSSAGTPMNSAVAVSAQDSLGNTVPSFTGNIALAIANNPGGSTLGGTTSAAATAGVATFGGLSLNHAGGAYTLSATATGLTAGISEAFDVSSGIASTLSVSSGAGQSAPVSTPLGSPITVIVTDPGGNGVAGSTVTFAIVSGGGSLSSLSGVSDGNGFVSTSWTLGALVGAQSISATSVGLAGSPLTINATGTTVPNHFAVQTQPGNGTAGINNAGFIVTARDPTNALVAGFVGTVTISLGSNPGGATLSGTASVTAVAGVATFNAFSLDKVGTGYTIVASSAGYTSVTSSAFNIVAGAATNIAITSGNAQTGASNALLAAPLITTVVDVGGNPVLGKTVTFAVAGGGGSVSATATVSSAAGRDSTTWTLGPSGAQSVTATAAGLIGSPLTFTATVAGGVASTTVTPKLTSADTITSIGATTTLTATARDAGNNVVAGTYVWLSRTPAVATVTNAGVVTAVTNGGTWIVATEAGNTKDSALVTVQQIVATISVTPANQNIYLGANFTFTAQAVDGLGHPLVAQPAFVWSSTQPAVASVSVAGVATGASLGSTQIRATSGAIIGVSNVNILTIIQHVYVARDSMGFPQNANDVFSMASLLLHRSYKAFAYDTLNNLVAGLTFTWNSSNPSVATIDSSGPVSARAQSIANGNVSISASVQGVTGAATLTVAQVLSSIAITPASATIAVSGSAPLTARGLDANGQFIAGGAFNWVSNNPFVATINAVSGVVTGVNIGSTSVKANIGAIVSANNPVTVSASVPPTISFGRDTVSVGRGSNAQVPILLSTPSASPVVVNLAVVDTFAFWSGASVTIPAGQTSINAQINGHNAGTTHITAIDQASVYATATSVLAVQASMHLTSGSYALNGTDQQSTQVLLSDPSPVGGTFVTFNYGTAGVASVSPSPAFIPAGQLAATIVITGVAAGTTTITPVAIGVNGTSSSFTTYAPVLNVSNGGIIRIGAGQFDANEYVYLPTYAVNPLVVTFTSSDPTVATVTASGTIAAGNYTFSPTISGIAPGAVTITATAPGWTTTHFNVVITTPRIVVCCGTTLNTTSPAQTYLLETQDSVPGYYFNRTSSLVVHVTSSNPAVLTVLDSVVTIAPGIYYNNTPRIIPGGTGGTAMLIATAGGHIADTTVYTVVGPKLQFSFGNNRLGLGQEDDNVYVYSPNAVVSPLTITLSGDTTITGFPATVTIPASSNIAYFNVRGKSLGSVPIIATASGYQADTATYTVTSPKVKLFGGGSLNNFSGPQAFTVESYDSVGSYHNRTTPLVVSFTSTDPTVITVAPTVTIAAGVYYANTQQVTPVGIGTAKVIATAVGHFPDTLTYTVVTPQLNLAFSAYVIGAFEHQNPTDFYAYTPNTRTTPLTVTLTDNHPLVAGLSTNSLTIAAGSNIANFTFAGLTPGLDTVTATAPGYLPITATIRVTTPKLIQFGVPSSGTTTTPPFTITIETADSLSSWHYASDTVVVHAVSSNTSVLQPAQAYFPILKNGYYAQSTINVVGPGTASITYTDSAGLGFQPVTSNTMTVTGPSLSISNGNIVLGNRQNTGLNGMYVYTPNPVASPLVVTLTSTDPTVAIPTVSTVTIPMGSNIGYFQINALDATGTIQVQATATGYGGISTNVQVTVPKFVIFTAASANTTGTPQSITVEAYDNGASPSSHYTNENVTITLASSASSVATTDSATVTILAGNYYHNTSHWIPGIVGTTQLSATDTRPQSYHYNTATANLTINTPTLTLNNFNQLGIGQYSDNYFYVQAPDNATSPITVTLTHPGTVRTTTPASVIIPMATNYAYFRVIGAVAGTDTVVASATTPVFNPATAFTTVGNGRIDALSGWPGGSLTLGDSVLITLQAKDPAQNVRNVIAATTFTLAPDSHIEFHSAGAVITSATIPANGTSIAFYMKAIASGTGSATISAANYTTYVNTVNIP